MRNLCRLSLTVRKVGILKVEVADRRNRGSLTQTTSERYNKEETCDATYEYLPRGGARIGVPTFSGCFENNGPIPTSQR